MYEYKVDGMKCNNCAENVTEMIKELDPTSSVSISLQDKRVHVESQKSLKEVAAAIEGGGFSVLETKQR